MIDKPEEKEFKIPLNFSELVFKTICEISTPQSDSEYNYRVSRLGEILRPFFDGQYRRDYETVKREVDNKIAPKPFLSAKEGSIQQAQLAQETFPLLIALCQRLGIISFEPKRDRRLIE